MGILLRSLCAVILLMSSPAAQAAKPVVGQPAPDFELTLIDGSKVALSQLRGHVVVLNFWATWCVPCRKELPTLDSYYGKMKDKGLRVFAITTEDSVPIGRLKELFAVMQVPSARRIKGGYGPLKALPTNFVIDRAGKLRFAAAGAFDLEKLNEILVPLLNEPGD